MPRFSLIIPTKDRPAMLCEALSALQAQDLADWEALVQDTGESVEAVLPKDTRIKYCRAEDPRDLRGDLSLRRAQGDLLNFHADDDVMLPGTLRHVSETIGDRMWLYGRINYGTSGLTMGDPWDWPRLKVQNYVPAPAAFWTRAARDIVGGWDLAIPWTHDWDYWLRLGARWEPIFTPRALVNYRVHPGQVTATMPNAVKDPQDELVRERARAGYYDVA